MYRSISLFDFIMRLVTHNLLRCNIRGLTEEQGYPLRIQADKVEEITAPYNAGIFTNCNLVS